MKHLTLILVIMTLMLSACATSATPQKTSHDSAVLTVANGTISKTYTLEDLQALPRAEAIFNDVTYVGVTLTVLLEDAGFDPDSIVAVKAVASDGFSANIDKDLALLADTLVAYKQADGPLADDELPFRMVLPEQGGKLNVRMLAELQVIK